MTSALRQRAVTEAASALGGVARVEPVLVPEGNPPPVVTDEVPVVPAGPARRVMQALRRGLLLVAGALRRVNLLAVALVVLGMGLAVFAMGLALYFWPVTPKVPEAATASAASAAASAVPASGETGIPVEGAGVSKEKQGTVTPLPSMPKEAPLSGTAASAVEPAAAESPASAVAAVAASPLPHGASTVEPAPAAASAASAAPASSPAASAAEPLAEVMDIVYGVDGNGNGVPDVLDRWLTRTLQSKVTQEAARQYYRTVLPLATKLHLGVNLSKAEKLSALQAAECYLVTAAEEGLRVPPNLNDRVLLQGGEAADRMKGLFQDLQGVTYPVSGSRRQACP